MLGVAGARGTFLSLAPRLREIRSGFERSFWIANLTELFERLAYYATAAVLAIYLNEQLHFSSQLTGWLIGTFGLVVWFLPILGGTLADRFGFRRALLFAYLVMTVGYFLLGSLS
jgi:dipeptide/tripeptide permease